MVRCTKCSGSMYLVKDYDGSFLGCLNCGKHLNIHFNKGIPTTKRNVVRVFNKTGLMKAAKHAEDLKKNRSVYTNILKDHIDKQPEDTLYPVVYDMIHNDNEFRLQIEIAQNQTIWLDVDIDKLDRWTDWYDTE